MANNMNSGEILTEKTWEHSLFEQTESQSTEEVPRLAEFREAVDHIIDVKNATLIKLIYLGAYRMSEVLAHVNPYEKEHNQTKAYGKSRLEDDGLQGRREADCENFAVTVCCCETNKDG